MGVTASMVSAILKSIVEDKIVSELVKKMSGILIDESSQMAVNEIVKFIEKEKFNINYILSEENMKAIDIPEDHIDYVVAEIKDLFSWITITDDIFRKCRYDEVKLKDFMWDEYVESRNGYIENESEIKRVLFAVSVALVKLVRENENFENEVLVHISNSVDDIIERLKEFNEEKECPQSNQYDSRKQLFEMLDAALNNEFQENPSIKMMEIGKELFPKLEKINWGEVNGVYKDGGGEKKFFQIVEESWGKKNTHLIVEGEGGIGKTVLLLTFRMYISGKAPIIYIPLRKLFFESNTRPIKDYIQKRTLNGDEEMYKLLEKNFYKEWSTVPNIVLILDGMNEIPINHLNVILKEIEEFSYKKGVQLIISSRYDVRIQLNLSYNSCHIKLKKLSKDQIKNALQVLSFDIPSEDDEIWDIINYPLLLFLYARNELMYNKISSKNILDWMENKTSGAIIWNYLQCEISKCESSHDNDMLDSAACVEVYTPYIVYQMQIHNQLLLRVDELNNYIESAYSLYKKIDISKLHIKKIMRYKGTETISVAILFDILTRRINLFRETEEGKFQLMHQNFRDCFAAIHLINVALCNPESIPPEWIYPIDNEVLSFMSHFMIQSKNESFEDGLWNHIWELAKQNTSLPDIFYTQMREIYKKVYSNNLFVEDFDSMSCRKCRQIEI